VSRCMGFEAHFRGGPLISSTSFHSLAMGSLRNLPVRLSASGLRGQASLGTLRGLTPVMRITMALPPASGPGRQHPRHKPRENGLMRRS
jgi:hypothetical protein